MEWKGVEPFVRCNATLKTVSLEGPHSQPIIPHSSNKKERKGITYTPHHNIWNFHRGPTILKINPFSHPSSVRTTTTELLLVFWAFPPLHLPPHHKVTRSYSRYPSGNSQAPLQLLLQTASISSCGYYSHSTGAASPHAIPLTRNIILSG